MLVFLIIATIPFAPAERTIVRTESAPEAWGGERDASKETLSDRVVAYSIEAELEPKTHTITARERLRWRNRSLLSVDTVYLHLYLNAFSSHDSTLMREDALLGHGSVDIPDEGFSAITLSELTQAGRKVATRFVHPDGGPDTDQTVLALDLPEPIAPGATLELAIAFTSRLPKVGDRAGYYGDFNMVAQWFPKIGVLELAGERGAVTPRWNVHEYHLWSEFYADFGSFDVRVTVPDGYMVAGVGEQVGDAVRANGKITTHFVQDDVHDFAWMATRDFAEPLQATWREHVAVKVFFPEEYRASAERCLVKTLESLDDFSDALWPYPYRTVTCIVPPYGAGASMGGMEYPTLFLSDGVRETPARSLERYVADFTAVHEFGHGYFYGIIASNEFEEPFLDEGLNQFWDLRFQTRRHQMTEVVPSALMRFGPDLHFEAQTVSRASVVFERQRQADPLADNAWHRLSGASYASVYSRTATVLETLSRRLAPGELDAGMRAYARRWRFRHPSTADLQAALQSATARPDIVRQTFEDFVYGTAIVDDRVSDLRSVEQLPEPSAERTEEAIKDAIAAARKETEAPFPFLTTVTVERRGASVGQTLRVEFEDGSTETVEWPEGERWHRYTWLRQTRARSAQLDPENAILLDNNKLNDGRSAKLVSGAVDVVLQAVFASLRWTFSLLVTL